MLANCTARMCVDALEPLVESLVVAVSPCVNIFVLTAKSKLEKVHMMITLLFELNDIHETIWIFF